MIQRERIKYGDSVPVRMSPRERDLITEHLFADPDLTDRLNLALVERDSIVVRYSLDDLDIVLGEIAAVANHTKSKKLRKELDALFDRIQELMESYEEIE